ncbi:hypothetical protein LCGC14_1820950 [marine sediment metagenome]|uniref:Uncharacterized protein n=1 Tax=marine sediment metagenome TaxID=412755 RepID=A0A0F9H750_9ZZZZ
MSEQMENVVFIPSSLRAISLNPIIAHSSGSAISKAASEAIEEQSADAIFHEMVLASCTVTLLPVGEEDGPFQAALVWFSEGEGGAFQGLPLMTADRATPLLALMALTRDLASMWENSKGGTGEPGESDQCE